MREFMELLLPEGLRTWYMYLLVGFIISQIVSAICYYTGWVDFVPLWSASTPYELGKAIPLPILFCLMFLWEFRRYRNDK